MTDFDSHTVGNRLLSHGLGSWTGSKYINTDPGYSSGVKDTFSDDDTFLKKRAQTWAGSFPTSMFAHGDVEPLDKIPVPSRLHDTDFIQRIDPDPLLTITPEKSLGLSRMGKSSATGVTVYPRDVPDDGDRKRDVCEGGKKSKPRVHFAPGTRTSPPLKTSQDEDVSRKLNDSADDDSVPRNYSSVNERLYQPACYADSDSDSEAVQTSKAVPARYTVETRDNKTLYVPMEEEFSSAKSREADIYSKKPVTAKIVKHLPKTSSKSKRAEEFDCSASDTEVKEVLRNADRYYRAQKPEGRNKSTSPHDGCCRSTSLYDKHMINSCSGSISPNIGQRPPGARAGSTSPSRPPYSDKCDPKYLPAREGEKPAIPVTIVREAPRRPPINDYQFPFSPDEQKENEYDPDFENPLARPEFNSALKISEDLKSVKERQPDTWGAVSKTLQTSNKKRTEIQEKASSRVNVEAKSDLFSGLVDIDVPLDDICKNREKAKTLQAPTLRPPPPKIPIGREPDIMEFFPADFQRELPDLTLTGIQPVTENLSTANPILAFDLYRHNRVWNGVVDS